MITRILSFDPSLRNWGYVVADCDLVTGLVSVVAIGTIQFKSSLSNANQQLMEEASHLFESLKELYIVHKPSLVLSELPHGSQSFSATKSYALVITLLGVLVTTGVPLKTVSAYDVKRTVGIANASKKDVVSWVVTKHPNLFIPNSKGAVSVAKYEHIADAIVVLYTHLSSLGVTP